MINKNFVVSIITLVLVNNLLINKNNNGYKNGNSEKAIIYLFNDTVYWNCLNKSNNGIKFKKYLKVVCLTKQLLLNINYSVNCIILLLNIHEYILISWLK